MIIYIMVRLTNIMPIMIIIIVFAVSIVVIASTLLSESGNFGIAQGQGNITTTSAANTTIRTEALPPSSPIPGLIMPEQPPSQPSQSESIQPPAAKSIAPRAVPEGNITSSEGIAPSEDKGGNCIAFLPCFNAARGGIIP
jgi:hypothetical protein